MSVNEDQFNRLVDPDAWTSTRAVGHRLVNRGPRVGEVVAMRYSAWRVVDVRTFDDVDLVDAEARHGLRAPFDVTLEHLAGPRIDGEDRMVVEGQGRPWIWLGARFQTCSCHGHPWPCLEYDRDVLAATLAQRAARQLARAQPGVCAGCGEKVRPRQQTVTFPEASLIVPGAPGPTFHIGRNECWLAARAYEEDKRLAAHATATRLVSCPGAGFVHHVGLRFECTAGPGCTGLHGPPRRYTDPNCATRVYLAENLAAGYQRPISDCGYRSRAMDCLGAETGPCKPSGMEGILFP